jgi:hypothetical protein
LGDAKETAVAGPEATIERWVEKQAKIRHGIESAKWGQDGWPDRVFFLPGGKPLVIEFKAPGEAPSERQAYRVGFLQQLGYDVEVHDDREQALEAIRSRVEAYFKGVGYGH